MRTFIILTIMGLLLGLTVVPAQAQSGDDYELSWWSITSGGGTSETDDQEYSLTGAIGQPATETLAGSGFSVTGGILTNESAAAGGGDGPVYLPVIIRN